ncbi:MAG: hypothetical protein IPK07_20275 [Deltaproteobacteria bacterium]|nr:hypothetical protein [Deltaproteobacteria bacterium]
MIKGHLARVAVIAEDTLATLELDRATFASLALASDRFAARVYRVCLEHLIDRIGELEGAPSAAAG